MPAAEGVTKLPLCRKTPGREVSIEDGKKTIWQFMLGIGLAYSSGAFLFEVFGNTGILMFVARIEFYTMLLLSVVFLSFGVTERLAFLSNSAISLMFNSGEKIISVYLGKLTASPFTYRYFFTSSKKTIAAPLGRDRLQAFSEGKIQFFYQGKRLLSLKNQGRDCMNRFQNG